MIAFPFDSHISGYDDNGYPIYDRASTSEEFALLFSSLLRDGVFGSGMCRVSASSGMTVSVSEGGMMIRGRFGYILNSETVSFEPAESRARIDTVVLRRDLSTSVNNIVCAVIKGTSGSNPTVPTLTRDGTIWELGIADVLIPANSTAISPANITDTRLDANRCGLIAAILTDIDTTGLYDQIQADLEGFKNVEQANFETWFETLQTQLEGDVAANLQSQLSVLQINVNTLEQSVAANETAVSGIQQQVDEVRQSAVRLNQASITLSSSSWSGNGPYTQTVSVGGVTSTNRVDVSPDNSSFDSYVSAKVRASAQRNGTLTFRASKKPSESLRVNVSVFREVG